MIGKITGVYHVQFNQYLIYYQVLFFFIFNFLKSSFLTIHQYIANVSPTSYPPSSAWHIYNKHLAWRISCSNPFCVLWWGWLEKWAGTGLWHWGPGKSWTSELTASFKNSQAYSPALVFFTGPLDRLCRFPSPESIIMASRPRDIFIHRNIPKYVIILSEYPSCAHTHIFMSQLQPDDSALFVLSFATKYIQVDIPIVEGLMPATKLQSWLCSIR